VVSGGSALCQIMKLEEAIGCGECNPSLAYRLKCDALRLPGGQDEI